MIGLEPGRTTNQDAFVYCLGTLVCEEEQQTGLWPVSLMGWAEWSRGSGEWGRVRSIEARPRRHFPLGQFSRKRPM